MQLPPPLLRNRILWRVSKIDREAQEPKADRYSPEEGLWAARPGKGPSHPPTKQPPSWPDIPHRGKPKHKNNSLILFFNLTLFYYRDYKIFLSWIFQPFLSYKHALALYTIYHSAEREIISKHYRCASNIYRWTYLLQFMII